MYDPSREYILGPVKCQRTCGLPSLGRVHYPQEGTAGRTVVTNPDMPKSDFRFSTPLRVRWAECDAQGIAFYGAYMGFLEIAQSEYFRHLGYSIYRIAETGYFDTVVAKATLEYKASARVDDMLDLCTRVSHLGNTSMIMDSEIYRQEPEELLLEAQLVYVGFDIALSSKKQVPRDIRAVVEEYEATGHVLPMTELPDLARAASTGSIL